MSGFCSAVHVRDEPEASEQSATEETANAQAEEQVNTTETTT